MSECRVLETWESKVPMWILKLGCRSRGLAATLEVAGCHWCLPRHIFWWCLFDRPLCALSSPPMTLGAIALMTACQNCSFKSWCEKQQFSTCQGLSDFFLLTWQGRNNFGSFLHRDFQCHVSEIVWLCSGRYIHCGTMFKAIFSGATNPNCPTSMRYWTYDVCRLIQVSCWLRAKTASSSMRFRSTFQSPGKFHVPCVHRFIHVLRLWFCLILRILWNLWKHWGSCSSSSPVLERIWGHIVRQKVPWHFR